ncbi:hypothetical protein AAG570_002608 [Ranatra chinensis]|uniref:Uncharacterized protein n=1 Tax=Ranatra chinensis TaxID=642074 RepID=A0ABD0Y8F5_9HEMI
MAGDGSCAFGMEVGNLKNPHEFQKMADRISKNQVLRFFPPGVGLFHYCTKEYILEGGQMFEKGTVLIAPSYSMQRDLQYFHDPDKFQLERFLDHHNVPSNVFLAFTAGPKGRDEGAQQGAKSGCPIRGEIKVARQGANRGCPSRGQ